jgi:hypothetical protein
MTPSRDAGPFWSPEAVRVAPRRTHSYAYRPLIPAIAHLYIAARNGAGEAVLPPPLPWTRERSA